MPLLPPEILDSILEHLLDKPATLKNCCLISKLWLPRVRRHLFAHVRFGISVSPVLWRKAFPDPSSSPGHHTHTLSISFKPVITGTDTGASNWIHTFHNVVHLELSFLSWAPLALYGLFPILRSLSLWCTPFDFSLICSFPLLEDLALVVPASLMDVERSNATLASPKLTGTLILEACGKIRSAIRPLLDRPGGIHFSKIRVTFCKEEAEPVSKLVSMCSKTLKSLTLFYHPSAEIPQLDLSGATRLEYITFQWRMSSVQWITATLRTIKSQFIERIDIYPLDIPPETDGEGVCPEWQDLDRLLVQLRTSNSILPRVVYEVGRGEKLLRDSVPNLLPELTRRGLVDLVEVTRQKRSDISMTVPPLYV